MNLPSWRLIKAPFLACVRVEEVQLDDVLSNVLLLIHILAVVLLGSTRHTGLAPWGMGPMRNAVPVFFARVEALCAPRGASHLD